MNKKIRVKDLAALAQRVKDITDDLEVRVAVLEALAMSLLGLTSSLIDTIGIGGEEA